MKNNRTWMTFLYIALAFAGLGALVGWVYNTGIHRPPLVFASIPQGTRSYLNLLRQHAGSQGLSFTEFGPFEWDNEDDLGFIDRFRPDKKSAKKGKGKKGRRHAAGNEQETYANNVSGDVNKYGWGREQDDNFVVYYHHDADAQGQQRARIVMQLLKENIDILTDVFGRYYYAADMNNRRLPIYLPSTRQGYTNTIARLIENPDYDPGTSLGLTVTQVGPLGCLTKGIVIDPSCFVCDADDINGIRKVLLHEMCHYMFFSSLNYEHDITHYQWVSEGIAEYVCQRHGGTPVAGADSIATIDSHCQLDAEFPAEGNCQYWAGESFFNYLDRSGGRAAVTNFLKLATEYSTDSVFVTLQVAPDNVHTAWVQSLTGGGE